MSSVSGIESSPLRKSDTGSKRIQRKPPRRICFFEIKKHWSIKK